MPDYIDIFIETLIGVSFEIQVCPCDPILSIKSKINFFEGIPVSQQHLIWQNEELNDQACFEDYNISDGSTLTLVLGLRGGPINTRRVETSSLTKLAEIICEVEAIEPTNPVTVILFQDGGSLRMFTIVGSEEEEEMLQTMSNSNESCKLFSEHLTNNDQAAQVQFQQENDALQQKMVGLQKKMKELNVSKMSRHLNSEQFKRVPSTIKQEEDKNTPEKRNTSRENFIPSKPISLECIPDNKIKCSTTLKAMGVKLPKRKTNLKCNNISSQYSCLTLPTKPKLPPIERPKTSPGLLNVRKPSCKTIRTKSKFTLAADRRPLTRLTSSTSFSSSSLKNLSDIIINKEVVASLSVKKKKKKSSKRCSWCKRKTGLATSYMCRCGNNFCSSHRYAETHGCSYDYKKEGRKSLYRSNPTVQAPKLPKI